MLSATLRDGTASPLPGETVSFTSANSAFATVSPASAVTDASGVAEATVMGVASGSALIDASAGTAADSVTVTVPTLGGLHWTTALVAALAVGWFLRKRLFAIR
jgi:hypothetical protein